MSGTVGNTGIGVQGNTGVGNTGTAGTVGNTGVQGNTGIGNTGVKGSTGAGTQGDTGVKGSTGVATTGNTGVQGNTGVGNTGVGTAGNTGVKGDTGAIGPITQNSQTTGYTLVSADVGKHISITTGGVTIPNSVFSAGEDIVIFNNSGSAQTITSGSGITLHLAGTASTGNRTLAQYGMCNVLCFSASNFVISGQGLN